MKHSQRGFSLIELMITVSIIGILAAIAYPSYQSAVLKGKRAQARTALAELLQQQERYATQRNTYMVFSSSISGSTITVTPTAPFKSFSGDNSVNTAYLLSAELCTSAATPTIAECVRVVATPNPSTTDPAVGALKMTSTGIKSCTGTTTNTSDCWP